MKERGLASTICAYEQTEFVDLKFKIFKAPKIMI